jgi:hypothetical protein
MLLLVAPAALADELGSEVEQGRYVAHSLQTGQRNCRVLSNRQFELLGEYAMDRFLGNRSAHETMNEHMTVMMGAAGERRMHIVLGQRYTGCATGSPSRWVTPMLGMMGRYGGRVPPGTGPGMMYGRPFGYGVGQPASSSGHADNGLGTAGVAAIAFGAALLGGLLVALGFWLRHRTA